MRVTELAVDATMDKAGILKGKARSLSVTQTVFKVMCTVFIHPTGINVPPDFIYLAPAGS